MSKTSFPARSALLCLSPCFIGAAGGAIDQPIPRIRPDGVRDRLHDQWFGETN